jgi:UDP:flavonoid glycosyltransferase YjiC (YdhE family)
VAVTGWTLTALLSTRLVGIPLATEHAGTYLPPVFERGLLPEPSMPVGPPQWLPVAVRRWLVNKGAERLTMHLDGFNRVASELGIAPVPSFPALLIGDLTLVTDVPEVLGISADEITAWQPRDPRRYRPNPRMRYTGPLFAHLSSPMPERVKRLLAEPGPVIYVAITSSPPALIRAVVNALRPLGTRILVAATVHDLDDLADDAVTVERVLPSHEIMPQVDLAVVSGGQGSVQTALASGLPFIGLPLQPEQDANVVMAERQGAARRLPTRSAGTDRLTRLAQAMLADPTYRTNARRLANVFAKVDGPGAAADAILELAADRR